MNKAKKYIIRALIFIACILLIGFSYNKIEAYKDYKKYKPVGQMVDVNNHKIHVFSKGEGDNTVVFVSGWGVPCPYSDFYPLMNEVSQYAKTVVYDRPGYGWSEITDVPRNVDEITREMHEALQKSGAKLPYILVGHSFGSMQVLRYCQMYKSEVKGVVLLDGVSPEYYTEGTKFNALKYKFLKETGIARVLFQTTNRYNSFTSQRNDLKLISDELKELDKSMALKNMYNKNVVDEGEKSYSSAQTIISNGTLGDIPLRILSAQSNMEKDEKWKRTQEDLTKWSSNSKQLTVEGTKHYIHCYYPEVVSKYILEIIK